MEYFYGAIDGDMVFNDPLVENKYGFKSGTIYDVALTGFTKETAWLKGALGGNVSIQKRTD